MFLIGHRALQKALRKSGVPPSVRQQKITPSQSSTFLFFN